MLRRLGGSLLILGMSTVLIGLSLGCTEREVKVIQQTEETHESGPEPVAPGEPIVE